MSTPAIEVRGLVKTFGRTRALDGLDLVVEPGQVHGFLGPNGAGKSTTIRVLLGTVRATCGTARLLGHEPTADPDVHARLAYVPGDVVLWRGLSGGETIDYLARLRGGEDAARRRELVEQFELDETRRSQTYSKGNRQKVALVAAFSSRAELLVLDEPTSGLDPLMEEVFQKCVRDERERGRTVLLSSHLMGEVESLCDHVTIVRAGRTVLSAPLEQVRAQQAQHLEARLREPLDPADLAGVRDVRVEGDLVSFDVVPAHLDDAVRVLSGAGVVALRASSPSLEELFLDYYRRDA